MSTHIDTPAPALDKSVFPETAKFMTWHESEKSKGLQDIKFFDGNLESATLESFFAVVNEALESESVPDKDIF